MNLAIMQPYFLPYIGYFQLINAVDRFIVYDNIQYTKKGWFNRNRLLLNGKDTLFSLPIKKGSDYLHVIERELAADFKRDKLLNQFRGAYRKAPFFFEVFPFIEEVVNFEEKNLFRYLHNSILRVCERLDISTDIKVASNIKIDHSLKGQEKVLAMCVASGAKSYINTIGGVDLYSKEDFRKEMMDLKFIRPKTFEYKQFNNEFVPWLSIVDVMMFNSPQEIKTNILNNYELV